MTAAAITEVYNFIQAYCDAEQLAYRAMLTEPDEPHYQTAKARVAAFGLTLWLTANIDRFEDEPLPTAEEAHMQLQREYQRRRLLRLEAYQLADGTAIYAAYLTGTLAMPSTGEPALKTQIRLLVRRTADGWQIISQQYPPTFAFPIWETTGGEKITLPDTPDEVVVYIPEENTA